jgi:hypothetical protein
MYHQTSTNLSKFQLPNGEHVSCILWNGLYHITGTDIGDSNILLLEWSTLD